MADGQTRIRLVSLDDVAELSELIRANIAHLRPWQPARDEDYFTEKRQFELAKRALKNYESGASVPFVIESSRAEILGRLTLSGVTRGALQSCALSYWVRADRLQEGHATRAVQEAVVIAFKTLGLHRMQAETLPENRASQIVLERAGFALFGMAPKYLRINGDWRDHFMFQLLNGEFE